MTKKTSKLDSFWDSVPDGTTLDEMTSGMDIVFKFEGQEFLVNTLAIGQFKTKPIAHYYKTIENRVRYSKASL